MNKEEIKNMNLSPSLKKNAIKYVSLMEQIDKAIEEDNLEESEKLFQKIQKVSNKINKDFKDKFSL